MKSLSRAANTGVKEPRHHARKITQSVCRSSLPALLERVTSVEPEPTCVSQSIEVTLKANLPLRKTRSLRLAPCGYLGLHSEDRTMHSTPRWLVTCQWRSFAASRLGRPPLHRQRLVTEPLPSIPNLCETLNSSFEKIVGVFAFLEALVVV